MDSKDARAIRGKSSTTNHTAVAVFLQRKELWPSLIIGRSDAPFPATMASDDFCFCGWPKSARLLALRINPQAPLLVAAQDK